MTESKEWNWNDADKRRWLIPSEDGIYLAKKWFEEGAKSVLDLGCGLGRHAVYFAKNGFKVTAVDLSGEAIEYTKALRKEYAVDFTCRKADMMKLPFATDAFDRVFSYHVISHQDTSGVRGVIDEITRVLKPGGKIFVTLCSKEHCAYRNPNFRHIDENTVLKTEGAEVEVPHFFADKTLIKELFHDYDFISVRHVTDCIMDEVNEQERCHYYIEAIVKKEATKIDYSKVIGTTVKCVVDRPLGSFHPRHKNIYYPINYGYVEGVFAKDGAEQDVYILGPDVPIESFTGKVIAVYHRYNDEEDKWIVTSDDCNYTDEVILSKIEFQERFFDGIIIR